MYKCAYAILPYKELIDITKQFSSEHDLDVLPDEKNAESAIPAALSAEKNGARVIISRGGTAEIIKKHVHIPVVDIRVSDLDILQVLYPLRGQNRKILVAGYKNAVTRCRSVAGVLELDIHELLIPYEKDEYDFDQIKYEAQKLINLHGIDTIIGDQTACVNLQSFCENLYLIKSGKEDVIEAIEKTETALASRFGRYENIRYVKNVLDSVNDAVLSADHHGIVTIFNRQAETLFNQKQEEAIGRRIENVMGRQALFGSLKSAISDVIQTGVPKRLEIQKPGSGKFLVNANPIMTDGNSIGVVVAIKESHDDNTPDYKVNKKNIYQGFSTRYTLDDILTCDQNFKKKVSIAGEYALSDATVLIEGESGTGKELFAQGIHSASRRRNAPFVAVNCAAIPPQLLESELFGYVDGAFTDAAKRGKRGLFEIANSGTIFLDEISEIDKSLQVKFLRVLEEKQIMRIGSDSSFSVDVRIIAAPMSTLMNI
jgi:PAS domain S-box-containing protein